MIRTEFSITIWTMNGFIALYHVTVMPEATLGSRPLVGQSHRI
jgi:hypothetical protein